MKANELRIGNYVMYSSLIQVNGYKIAECEEYPTRFAPIPLTREWLIKFKFEELEKDCRTFFKKGKFKVELSNGGNVYYNRNIFISSVHQLQNLYFALTGEELTFKEE